MKAVIDEIPSVHVIRSAEGAHSALDPLRADLLRALHEPDSAAGVARRLGLTRQQANYHLRQLEAEGLVREVGERRRGNFVERLVQGVARSYVISPELLGALATRPDRVRDQASSAFLVALAARTIRELAALRADADTAGKRLPTLSMDTEVRFASPDAQRAFTEELQQAVAGLVTRYHDADAAHGRTFRMVVGTYPKRG